MMTLSAANTKYSAEQLTKVTGISAETMADWGLIEATDTLTVSELTERAASDSRAKTALNKIIALNAEEAANGKITVSNTALTASEGGVTLATGAFTTAIKANIKAMIAWMKHTPLGLLTMLVGGVFLAVKAYDALTVSVKEQETKMENSLSAYYDAKSALSNITTELENQEQAIDDLLGKEKITYAEQGQLDKLQAITKELRIQKDLAKKEEERTQKKAAKEASILFNKQFGKYDISKSSVDDLVISPNLDNEKLFNSKKNDIPKRIAAYIRLNNALDKARSAGLQADADSFKRLIETTKDSLFETAQDLQKQQSGIVDYYNTIKDTPYDDLTPEQKDIVESYHSISDAIELIYQYLDPNAWKAMQIESVFDTEGIEKTKDELIEMVKAGTFDESTLQSYPKLSEALEQNNVSARELCNELEALAEAEGKVTGDTLSEEDLPLSTKLTNSADSLDAFQSSVKSAVDAYATLLSGNYSSTDLLNSIQAINKAATDMGKSIRWEEIDSLDALGDQIEEISQAYADSVLSDAGLSKDSKFGQMLTDIIRASYQSEAALSSLNTQIDSLQDSYRNLNDIVDTYNEHGHITFDQLQTLLDMEPRYLSCLVSEDGQLRLNQDAMQELAAMRLADAKALIIQQAVTELGELAQKREKKAVEDNTMALTDNMETLTTYERRIIDLLPGLGLTGNEFCRISNAINGAMQDGASDEDIDEVLRNAAKKVKFITGMADGNIDDMFGGFSSAAVSATEELNSYLDAQEKALDAGKISFREYCDSISSHIRKAYDNGKISAKEFWDYQGQFLEKQKSSYDKVISAVTRKLDGEIDALRDRQDEIDGFYESQISSLEETRKLLQENNDERKRQADLQKALYEMERAHNQRTVLQYSEGMGMHYVSDPNAVRDAENSVADARLNIRTAEIDSAISRLERQRDSEKSAIDEIIRNLEAYKAKWSEVSSAFEEAQEDQLAAEILGQEWEADVLGMRIDTLSAFAENYVNLQRTIADAAWESAKAQAEAQKLINEQTSDAPGNRSAAIKKVADYGAGIANALRDKFDLSKHPLKFHTGLKQGLVDTPSLNRDFKLVQDVGLGRNEVPAVLKKGEIVATQEQVSNLAAGLRQAGSQTILVNGMELRALQPGDETYDLMQKWDTYFGRIDGNVEKLLPGSFFEQREQVTASANHIVSNNVESHNRDVQPTIHNEIHVTLPNVTNATSAETLLKDLQSLGTKKLQVNW